MNHRAFEIDVLQNLRSKAGGLAVLPQPVAVTRITCFGHSDKKHWRQRFEFNSGLSGQRTVLWQCHDGFVGSNGTKLQSAERNRLVQSHEPDIEFAILERSELLAAREVEQINRNRRKRLM